MDRLTAQQSIIEHLEQASGLVLNAIDEAGDDLRVNMGIPAMLQYHYVWNGERFRFCCAGLMQPHAWTYVGIEAARKAAAAGKGAV